MSCSERRDWYERPAQLVRRGGHVVDVKPAQLIKLCPHHRLAGDVLVGERVDGRCGFAMRVPPRFRFVERRRPRRKA